MDVAGTERRPVVEFAIENAQTLKKREMRRHSINAADGPCAAGAAAAAGGQEEGAPADGAEPAAAKRKPRKRKREGKDSDGVRRVLLHRFMA